MRIVVRWVIGILAGLLTLLVLAGIALTVLVDPNVFKGRIEATVRDATGRPFHIDGDLDLAFFPWLAVESGPARLGNPPGIEGPPLAQWRAARVGVQLIPLVRGELIVDRVRLEALQLHLRRAADGRANWEPLLVPRGPPDGATRLPREIGGIELRDASVDYRDARSGTHLMVSNWRLEIGAWRGDATVPIETELALVSASRPPTDEPLRAKLRLTTRARVVGRITAPESVSLSDTALGGALRGGPLGPEDVPFELALARASVEPAAGRFEVPQWSLRLADARLAGGLTGERQSEAMRLGGPLEVSVPSLSQLMTTLGTTAPRMRGPNVLGPFALQGTWSGAGGAFQLGALEARLDQTRLTGELGRTAGPDGLWTVALRGDRIDLDRYLGPEDAQSEPFELPVEQLKALRVQGTLHFEEAQLAGARMKDVRLSLTDDPS